MTSTKECPDCGARHGTRKMVCDVCRHVFGSKPAPRILTLTPAQIPTVNRAPDFQCRSLASGGLQLRWPTLNQTCTLSREERRIVERSLGVL